MFEPVPGLVDVFVVETVVSGQINDSHAKVQKLRNYRRARSMRQTAEAVICPLGDLLRSQVFALQIETPSQRRMNRLDRWRTFLPGCRCGDLNFRVSQQDSDQLNSGVTGGSGDGDSDHEWTRSDLFAM